MTQIMKNIHISPAAGPAETQAFIQKKVDTMASELAADVTETFKKFPDNFTLHQQTLIDLKQKVTDLAAELDDTETLPQIPNRDELLWSLALHMPDFDTDSLYQKRASLASIGVAIIVGWFVGGIVATLLGFIGLGGEILRPLAIFACIWLGEWISTNPNARRIALTALGLGGLVRFSSLVVGGLFRFTSIGALKQAIFGAVRPNIFKGFWLLGGAFFVLLLLSKKIAGMDIPAFRQSLHRQIEQRLNFLYFALKELEKRGEELKKLAQQGNQAEDPLKCPRSSCNLAMAVMDVLGSLEPDNQKYLAAELQNVGFMPQSEVSPTEYFIWNSDIHSKLYETVGIVRNGDRCKILKAPYTVDGKVVRGHAQRASDKR